MAWKHISEWIPDKSFVSGVYRLAKDFIDTGTAPSKSRLADFI